jgi:hypothetical protein
VQVAPAVPPAAAAVVAAAAVEAVVVELRLPHLLQARRMSLVPRLQALRLVARLAISAPS